MLFFVSFNTVNTIFSIFIVHKCIKMYNDVEKRTLMLKNGLLKMKEQRRKEICYGYGFFSVS